MRRFALLCACFAGACADDAPRARICVVDSGTGEALRALPGEFVDWWVAPGSRRVFIGQVSRADCGSLEGVSVTSDQAWLTAELRPGQEAALRRLVLTVDAAQLDERRAGEDGHDEALVRVVQESRSVEVRVRVRVIRLLDVHVGYGPGTCRRTVDGVERTDCDVVHSLEPTWGYVLDDALVLATEAHSGGGVRFLLYDHFGVPVQYDANVRLGPDSWLSAAPGIPASHVVLVDSHDNLIQLDGDRVYVGRVTLGTRCDTDAFVAAASSPSSLDEATRGHLIENVVMYNYCPTGADETRRTHPFLIGADTMVRNNYIHGFFDDRVVLRAATGSRIVGNTIILYGDVVEPWRAAGAKELTIANNVVVTLTRPQPHWIEADGTSELTVTGNVIEGFERAVGGAEVGDNDVGTVELESPWVPKFLADSEQRIGRVPGEGFSLDGNELTGRLDLRPGAFQESSRLSSPRRLLVRVGNSCGGEPCDISAVEPDALQKALWSSWPGGTVELYPHPESYGRGMISWGTTLIGMGQHAGETRVRYTVDSDRLNTNASTTRAAIYVAPGLLDPVHVSNLSLLTHEHGLVHHGTLERSSHDRHLFERLVIVRDYTSSPDAAVVLGHNAVLRDVLIHGNFESCLLFGGGPNVDYHGPLPAAAWVTNLTCWLTGYENEWPEVAFWVGNVRDALLANLVVEVPDGTALFGATRNVYDEVYPPDRFTARAISHRGVSTELLNMTANSGYDLQGLVAVPAGNPFLLEDGRLASGAPGIDTGVDPGSEPDLLRFSVELGRAIDGVARAGRVVDQGAYEQGN